jgi:hypothetical protein
MSQLTIVLSERQLDRLAEKVAEHLRASMAPSSVPRLVDATTVATALGVSRDCVYAHAQQLGVRRIGGGRCGRLRFDLDYALRAWTRPELTKTEHIEHVGRHDSHSRRRSETGEAQLLPIRGESAQLPTVHRREAL